MTSLTAGRITFSTYWLNAILLLFCSCGSSAATGNGSPTAETVAVNRVSFPIGAVLRRDPVYDTVTFLKHKDLTTGMKHRKDTSPVFDSGRSTEIVLAFMNEYAQLFRLKQPSLEWRSASTETDELGMTHVRLNQYYEGFQVWSCQIVSHFDRTGNLYLLQGHYIPTPNHLSLQPLITASAARELAYEDLGKTYIPCSDCTDALVVMPQKNSPALLVYRLEIRPSLAEGWEIFVDAHDGRIVKKLTTVLSGSILKP